MEDKLTAGLALKQKNKTDVFQLLRKNQSLSKQDIVTMLQLSLPTVTQNLEILLAEGLIEENGMRGHTGGRKAKTYGIKANAKVAIGLDITKVGVRVVALDLTGNIIASMKRSIPFSRTDAYYQELGNLIDRIIEKGNLIKEHILGVGIGVPGLITPDKQEIFYGEILQITGATCQEFSKYIPYPTALYNDAKAAGFAEAWVRPELQNFFYISLGNNVGGSIYINNQQYSGENIRGGEVGHIRIVPDGKQCYCGQKGCVDSYCSATVLSDLTGGDLPAFFALLNEGDRKADGEWREYLEHLASTVITVRMLFDCTVILGGYVGEHMEHHLDELKSVLAGLSGFEKSAEYLLLCAYKKEAIAAGAALNYIARFVNSI